VQDNRRCYSPSTFGSSPRCDSAASTTTFQTTTTDNYNQILLVDNQRDFLVTCGSVFQVYCVNVLNTITVSFASFVPHYRYRLKAAYCTNTTDSHHAATANLLIIIIIIILFVHKKTISSKHDNRQHANGTDKASLALTVAPIKKKNSC